MGGGAFYSWWKGKMGEGKWRLIILVQSKVPWCRQGICKVRLPGYDVDQSELDEWAIVLIV